MKINGTIEHPLWYDIKCKCDHSSLETEFPIADCLHCQFQRQEDSMPQEDFVIKQNDYDEEGNVTGQHNKTIREITIHRGDKYEEIRGWTF